MAEKTEVWLTGPVEGIEAMLLPVAHALLQARADIQELAATVAPEHVWARPGGAGRAGTTAGTGTAGRECP